MKSFISFFVTHDEFIGCVGEKKKKEAFINKKFMSNCFLLIL